ncbi:aminodeoxychorismate lyase [Sulfuriferula nivalis]|uniref:aminodeoxychorismate lyase n=1 Tax=Sulfuriferula nivalis TaxID=2675298 RepID=A0A809RHL7_9PROT|nr:aminodeoxychorismate lyase [Sulfuriferula nivalis]BBP01116.1 aminodeoxychorismate lyase [Sulfuriferula nivalis]
MILVNGDVCTQVAANDRGLSYGDGVFRTMLMQAGKVKNWSLHYAKLVDDCSKLALTCPDNDLFKKDISNLSSNENGVIKLMVTRGIGMRGYAVQSGMPVTRISMWSAMPQFEDKILHEGIRARWCQLRLSRQPVLAGVKHLNRLENVLARSEWQDADILEGLLMDESGNVICGTMSNVFVIKGRYLYTPDLSGCGIAGVTRARVLAGAESIGLMTKITVLSVADVLAADEVIVTNSVIGIWQIRSLAERRWEAGQFTPLIRAYLEMDND